MLKVFRHFVAMTLDIKNAYLMAVQTEDGKAYVEVDGKVYSACQDNEQQHRSGFSFSLGLQKSLAWSSISCSPHC